MAGKITVIHGPMFSGKTEELLRRIRRARIARKKVILFKPASDDRYSNTHVLPHHLSGADTKDAEQAISVESSYDIYGQISADINVVGIEEAQFFDSGLLKLVRQLSYDNIDVVLSLLDQDFRRQPFKIPGSEKNIGDYLAIAHTSIKLSAICVRCGSEAQHSQKLILSGTYPQGEPVYVPASYFDEIVAVGTNLENTRVKESRHPRQIYEARCLNCHEIPDEPEETYSLKPSTELFDTVAEEDQP